MGSKHLARVLSLHRRLRRRRVVIDVVDRWEAAWRLRVVLDEMEHLCAPIPPGHRVSTEPPPFPDDLPRRRLEAQMAEIDAEIIRRQEAMLTGCWISVATMLHPAPLPPGAPDRVWVNNYREFLALLEVLKSWTCVTREA